jgi:hypothetical protein
MKCVCSQNGLDVEFLARKYPQPFLKVGSQLLANALEIFPLKMGGCSTQAWMPTYVSIFTHSPDDMSLDSDGGIIY